MRVALVQVASPPTEAVADRIRRVEGMIRSIKGADLIVLPELWAVGYANFVDYVAGAETLDGPTVSMCARAAAELGTYIHTGSIVHRTRDNQLKNTAILLNPAGNIIHRYSGLHVLGYDSREAQLLSPGASLPVADLPFGTTASAICYDLRFPRMWNELRFRGTVLMIVPGAWPTTRVEQWSTLTSARAVEHQIFVVACNAVGGAGTNTLGGRSRVVSPTGLVIAEAGDTEGITYADVDLDDVRRVRQDFRAVDDERESYVKLSNRPDPE